jgi:hypothetical protein
MLEDHIQLGNHPSGAMFTSHGIISPFSTFGIPSPPKWNPDGIRVSDQERGLEDLENGHQLEDALEASREGGCGAEGFRSAEPTRGRSFLTGTYMTDCPGSGFGHVARSLP